MYIIKNKNNLGDSAMLLFKRFSIFKMIGIILLGAVALFFVFKASITGSII